MDRSPGAAWAPILRAYPCPVARVPLYSRTLQAWGTRLMPGGDPTGRDLARLLDEGWRVVGQPPSGPWRLLAGPQGVLVAGPRKGGRRKNPVIVALAGHVIVADGWALVGEVPRRGAEERVSALVPREEARRLAELARSAHTTTADLIRRALREVYGAVPSMSTEPVDGEA